MDLQEVHMAPRARRRFTAEFKAETVELVRTSGKPIGQVCRDLDLTETAVRRWVLQAEIDAGKRPGLTTAERAELAELRRENRVLREEREILKKQRPSSRGRRRDEPVPAHRRRGGGRPSRARGYSSHICSSRQNVANIGGTFFTRLLNR